MRSLLMNAAGLAASVTFVLAVIAGAAALGRAGTLDVRTARKTIHIALAHWWLIALVMFDDPWVASAGPACSLLAACFVPGGRLLPVEEGAARSRDRGAIYYSAALLVLVNLSWRGLISMRSATVGVLVMGWGDGLAGLIGARFLQAGITIWGRKKTAQGTAVMFFTSFVVTLLLILVANHLARGLPVTAIQCLCTAAVATCLELFTPWGLDNITIPVGTALFFAGAFG